MSQELCKINLGQITWTIMTFQQGHRKTNKNLIHLCADTMNYALTVNKATFHYNLSDELFMFHAHDILWMKMPSSYQDFTQSSYPLFYHLSLSFWCFRGGYPLHPFPNLQYSLLFINRHQSNWLEEVGLKKITFI